MLQPRQNDLLTRLLNLPRQKDLVQDRIHLVKVKYKIQLAHVSEKRIQHLYKEVDRLEVRQLIVIRVDARAEEESRVSAVDDLIVAELDEVGLVFLVTGGHEAVDFAFELDLFVVAVGGVPFCEAGFASGKGGVS